MVLQGPSARGRFLYGAAGNFAYLDHSVGPIAAGFKWTAGKRGSPANLAWPPKGVALTVRFHGGNTTAYRHFVVSITYEIFDGAPLMTKRLALEYSPGRAPAPAVAVAAAASGTAGGVPAPAGGAVRNWMPAGRASRRVGQRQRSAQTSLGWSVLGGVLALADGAHGACFNNTHPVGDARPSQAVWSQLATSVSIAVAG